MRAGSAGGRATALAEARRRQDRSAGDLAEGRRLGARLVTPEDREWPDEALRAMQVAYDRERGARRSDDVVELTPPLALWALGAPRLDEAFVRAVAVVGARAATPYGTRGGRPARVTGWRTPAGRWCPAARSASTRPRTAARLPAAG